MPHCGTFTGVGVGPGGIGFITVAALRDLQTADVIFLPKGKVSGESVARQCLRELDLPAERFREVIYDMDSDKQSLQEHYKTLAREIALELEAGKNVAYVTLGDALTYSTYSYTLQSLKAQCPRLNTKTYPGITSYTALAAATDWPLGQGKERTLILPCPEDKEALIADIESHDIVVLMKIGKRLPMVLEVLNELNITAHCVFARKLGLPDEYICSDLKAMPVDAVQGYFSTMLIRKRPADFKPMDD